MKLLAIGKKEIMLALDFGDGKKTWVRASQKVYDYAKINYKPGDIVTPAFAEEKVDDMQLCTMLKKGELTSAPKKEAVNDGKPKCEDCGYTLKDSKYKKCYKCNQKNPAPKSTSTSTPKDTNLIKREAVAHAASRVIIGLQGHVDPNNVEAFYTKIYNFILKLVDDK